MSKYHQYPEFANTVIARYQKTLPCKLAGIRLNPHNPTERVDFILASHEDNFVDEGQFIKLSLGFDSANNYHRQILLGFMNQYATSGFDNGYDGVSFESHSNDMYFINNGSF
jgi:hypothetical protein